MSWEGRELETIENLLIEIRDRLPEPRDAPAEGGEKVDTDRSYHEAAKLEELSAILATIEYAKEKLCDPNRSHRAYGHMCTAATDLNAFIQRQGKQ